MKKLTSKINNITVIIFLILSFGIWFLLDAIFGLSRNSFNYTSVSIVVIGIFMKIIAEDNAKKRN